INAGGAKVVGVDILLFEPDADPGGDEAFAEALGESQYAINILQITRRTDQQFTSQTLSQPLSLYRQVLDGTGITSFVNDEDAIVRSVQAFTSFNEALYFNWAFDAARLYLDVEPPSLVTQNRILFNGQIIPLSREQLLVNFAGPAGTYT